MVWVIVLYLLAAVLPIAGFGRLLWRAQAAVSAVQRIVNERGHPDPTIADISAGLGSDIRASAWNTRNALVWDICLVGTGLIAGAVASIWSLYL